MFDWAKKLWNTLTSTSSPDCARARAEIPGLIDEEAQGLDADTLPHRAWLLVHLDGCKNCTAEYHRQSTTRQHPRETEIAALAQALNGGEDITATWLEDVQAHCAMCPSCANELRQARLS